MRSDATDPPAGREPGRTSPNAVLRGAEGHIGRFTADRGSASHRWQWSGEPWPADGFTLEPDRLGPSAAAAGSDVYGIPPVTARRMRTVAWAARRLYDVVCEEVVVAVLAVCGAGLHWFEVDPGTLDRMGTEPVAFRPRSSAGMAPADWSRSQRPRALAASCGPWPERG